MDKLIESIIFKSQKLVDQKNELLKENQALKEKIKSLENQILDQELNINNLTEKQKVKYLAGVFEKKEKIASLKKIDEVMRKIDHCIAQINS